MCVTLDEGGQPGVPACAIALGASPVNAAVAGMGGGVIAVYGRVADGVTRIEATSPASPTASLVIYDDPRSGQRFFADLVTGHAAPQLAAVTPSGRLPLTDLNAKLATYYR